MLRYNSFFWLVNCLTKTGYYKINIKSDWDKKLTKEWQPNTLLNVNTKLISDALACHLKTVISTIVNKSQVAYVKSRLGYK